MTDKKFKRKLTPFLCQEMLYDYAIGRLDADRRSAVDEFLQNDKECRHILEAIKQGLIYADQLTGTKLNPSIEEQLKESENVLSLGRKYSSWKEWPEVVRWSITALVVSTSVAVLIALVPWSRIALFKEKKHAGGNSLEIAQVPNTVPQQIAAAKDTQEIEPSADDESSGDDASDEGENPSAAAIAAAKVAAQNQKNNSDRVAALPTPVPGKKSIAKNQLSDSEGGSGDDVADTHNGLPAVAPVAPVPLAAKTKPTPAAVVATSGIPTADADAATESTRGKEAKPKGFVYRAFMTLSNLDEVGPKITDNIKELGGEKAGEVELGWKRGTGRYYHFSLPEESEEKILEELRAYGPVRISKDPHPRVMPKGKIRFILWIESAN